MEVEGRAWLAQGWWAAGQLRHGPHARAADLLWTPDVAEADRLRAVVDAIVAAPDPMLPRPLGLAVAPDGVAVVVQPLRGIPLSSFGPLPVPGVEGVAAGLIALLDGWRALIDPSVVLRLGPGALSRDALLIGFEGDVLLARPDRLALVDGRQEPGDALTVLALGELLAALLTGRDVRAQLAAAADGPAHGRTVRELTSGVTSPASERLLRVIARMLAFNPRRRPTLAELVAWAEGLHGGRAVLRELVLQSAHLLPEEGDGHPWAGRAVPVVPLVADEDLDAPITGASSASRVADSAWASWQELATEPRALPAPPRADRPLSAEERYEVLREVGVGGMGRVFGVRDPVLQRDVALKVLDERLMDDQVLLSRFLREVQVTARLEHPNVVPVHALEVTDSGAPAFTMKLVEGITFSDYLRACRDQLERGHMDEDHRLPARLERFLKVCDAVSYGHSKGVVHRDLKLSNLMVGPFGEVYVMDWGVARLLREAPDLPTQVALEVDHEITQVGEAVGTAAYMSPEQAAGRHEDVGPASDQFTLGLILYELAALVRAREHVDARKALELAKQGWERRLIDAVGDPLPAGLRAIIARAAAPEPADRYPDVAAFAEDVRRFMRGQELEVLPDGPIGRVRRWASNHPSVAVAVLLGVLALASAVGSASLYRALVDQAGATVAVSRSMRLVTEVGRRSRALDDTLQHHERLLEGVAVAAGRLLEEGRDGPLARSPSELAEDQPDVRWSERRGQLVTFAEPILLIAPAARPDARDEARRLHGLGRYLRGAALRSLGRPADPEAALLADDGPLMWTLAGFESGVFVSYPGHANLPDGYDPRTRPWYRRAAEADHAVWGTPHLDSAGTGMLLACSVALRDAAGALRGVAAVELDLDRLARDAMRLDLPGWRATDILDGDGRVVLHADPASAPRQEGDVPAERFAVPDVVAAALDGVASGMVQDGLDLLFYDRMATLGWTYVVRVAPEPSGARAP